MKREKEKETQRDWLGEETNSLRRTRRRKKRRTRNRSARRVSEIERERGREGRR